MPPRRTHQSPWRRLPRRDCSVSVAEEDGDGSGGGIGAQADDHHILLAIVIEVRYQEAHRVCGHRVIGDRLVAAARREERYRQAIDGKTLEAGGSDAQPGHIAVANEIGE